MVKVEGGMFNADDYDDLVSVDAATGKLFLYPGQPAGGVFGNRVEIGSGGWNGMTELASGEFNRDAFHDIAAVQTSTGKLFLYPGTAAGKHGTPVVIGTSGWNGMSRLAGGDFNRDGFDDLVASQDSTGELYLYPGTAAGKLGARVEIGTGGWNGMSELTAGDFTKDGHDDLVAVENSTGKLWVYPGVAANKLGARAMIGTGGWAAMNELTVGNFNRNGDEDLVAMDKDSKIWLYPGTTTPVKLGARVQIGSGDW
jgi:hypothetical protein